MKKILITGSSGFIGQHLTKHLAGKFEIHNLQSDLQDHSNVRQEVMSFAPDMVIHLAARTEVESSFYEQITFADVNYIGTVNLIESVLSCSKLPKFLFASSMEVYGWQPISDKIKQGLRLTGIPAFDVETVANPNAPYAVAKHACEKYIEYVSRSHGLEYVILRQTNTYGRKDNKFFVVEQIITQMLAGSECRLGYKDPYRNFLYIDDLIEAWKSVVENFNRCKNRILTLGPDNAVRIEDLANTIADKLDWTGTIVWDTKPARPGEIYLLNSSDDDIKKLTGWHARTSLSDGLDKTIEIWKKNLA
jgi:GDP-4-dehydro-6-deoxy-D-mannose reductase